MRLCLLLLTLTSCARAEDRPVYRPTPDPGPPPATGPTQAARAAPGLSTNPSRPQTPPAAPSADPHRAARDVWIARCATCHGEEGRGDGPASRLIRPRPSDFTDAAWHDSRQDAQLERMIVEGGAAVGRSPSMPAGPDLRGPTAQALVKLIRTFKM